MQRKSFSTALVVLVVLLALPMAQQFTRLIPTQELHGSYTKTEWMPLNVRNWFSGEFQETSGKFATENFGFRNELIRTGNQINYSLYHEINAAEVIEGKDGVLFEYKYIESYTGLEKVDESKMDTLLRRAGVLSKYFASQGKFFGIVLYPGKASFFPEYIPDAYPVVSERTNYVLFRDKLQHASVPYIDMNAWFKSMKGKSYAPLFSEIGIHWSQYGACLGMDTLLNFVEKTSGREMNHFVWTTREPVHTLEIFHPDNDMELSLNVLQSLPHSMLCYPELKPEVRTSYRPRMAVFTDSFFFNVLNLPWQPDVLSSIRMYYYNRELYEYPAVKVAMPDLSEKMKDLDQTDVVLIMATEYNVDEIGWGIVDELYEHFGLANHP